MAIPFTPHIPIIVPRPYNPDYKPDDNQETHTHSSKGICSGSEEYTFCDKMALSTTITVFIVMFLVIAWMLP